ncbi:WecB/TagA/CpsF family glycosyltransferase [Vibrio splendidus]|uniref:WecB/TagA/CpsF family glycosyltransferase n=1 Tax=Vibrio splendidus TaxID=29497 RepID=UPI0024687C7F|nr:WecB/TagA/CpsF family glycosyltransferase [Vibrio splendidus]MDH5914600.1 WecB/TagA/CpsF family glycosyltransferase [Vibrio splendidus]MDH5943300.1 WecB/TagA/CpsF family glycosyltransferase [Vibrio splendidus]MDH5987926.1 WecB/TagA/CpsF family glycosyltransferase [Vibrio splendidus]MDH5995049.1 WecB/TagA/CpsF family glycosyltransferase [Vibrio splendidus]MDH6007907.1 WecB/TagA/CpsF family glycosyltransferase [Vibrio splendidus]
MEIKNFTINSIDLNTCNLYSFVNPYSYYLIKGSEYERNIEYFADGILLVVLYNLFSYKKIERYSFDFTSLANVICKFSEDNNLKVSLIGGKEEEINAAKLVLEKKFPNISIPFIHHGYISECEKNVLDMLAEVKPDIIICGMGTPMQEKFLLSCKNYVPSLKLGFTCGGFLSQISGNENYFHPVFDKLHLRWLQRFLRHGYVRKRILIDYPIFVLKFLKEKLFS